jgi:glycosyltransferase involved in cell wall biosynthesis
VYTWQIITGEYAVGGVGDYTRRIALSLADSADEVNVWAPMSKNGFPNDEGVLVHALPGRFGARALMILDHAISAADESVILVQYVPHAFGFKAMNLPFCCWLSARRRCKIFVMFHEVAFEAASLHLRHSILEVVTKVMARLVAGAASRIFVSTSSWERMLQPMLRRRLAIESLPVPSNVDVVDDTEAIRETRLSYVPGNAFLIGHFSSYPENIQPYLCQAIPALLSDRRVGMVLIGRGSKELRQVISARSDHALTRLHATGELGSHEVSLHLSACDLMIQPYPEGITTRRTSTMAAIAHRRPVVTTKGELTEPIWSETAAVSLVPVDDIRNLAATVGHLLDDLGERERLGQAAFNLYRESFDLRHTVNTLRT